jgi:DNA-binding LacI/PurR family transcriptional regulator
MAPETVRPKSALKSERSMISMSCVLATELLTGVWKGMGMAGRTRGARMEGRKAKSRRQAGERLTMADLAALAKVSKITVSRALRNSDLVRKEVRDQIHDLARNHGYRLNVAARSLRTRRAHSITAVIEMDPSDERPMTEPLTLTIIGGLLQAFTMRGYSLALTTQTQVLNSALHDTDGIILLGQGENDEATSRVRRLNLPMAVWGHVQPASENMVFVGSDNFEGGRLVGEHLAALGRRRILFLGDINHSEVADRFLGLSHAISGSAASARQISCAFSREAGHAAVTAEIGRGESFDAIAACSDPVALGAMDALQSAKITVPREVAVAGFDDTARESRLTSVRQDWDRAGRLLADKILSLLAGDMPASEKLPVELIVRGSTQG